MTSNIIEIHVHLLYGLMHGYWWGAMNKFILCQHRLAREEAFIVGNAFH